MKLKNIMLTSLLVFISSPLLAAKKIPPNKVVDMQVKFNRLVKQNATKNEAQLCKILEEIAQNEVSRDIVNEMLVSDWVERSFLTLKENLPGQRMPRCALPALTQKYAPAARVPMPPAVPIEPTIAPRQTTVPSAPPMPQPPIATAPEIPVSTKEIVQPKPSSLPELVNYVTTMAGESEDVRKLAQKYDFVNPIGTINTKDMLADLAKTEKDIKQIARSISSEKLAETEATIVPQLTMIRNNIERFQVEQAQVPAPQAPLSAEIQEHLQAIARMAQESQDVPAIANKIGLVQNGVVNIDALLDAVAASEQAVLDLAQSRAERVQIEGIITPQVETIRTNIENYRRAQAAQAQAIPEAPPFEERPAQAPVVKPKKPKQQPTDKPQGPTPAQLQEAAAKLKHAEEREKTQEIAQNILERVKKQNVSPTALSIAQQDELIRFYLDNAKGPLYELPDEDKKILIALLSAQSDRVGPNAQISAQLAQLRYGGPREAAEVQQPITRDWPTD